MADDLRSPSYTLTFEDAVDIHLRIMRGEIQSRIAADFDVNGGRISEVNTGKTHPNSREEALHRSMAGMSSQYIPRPPGPQLSLDL